ncbi:MAG: sialate O-acetylesterase, partial [Bacteroidales bacterium]
MKTKSVIFFLVLLCYNLLVAQIKVSSVIGDNMVLQRNSEVKIWGKANVSQKLIISSSWNKSKVSVTSDGKGTWTAKLKTTEAGGPYTITIASEKEKVTIKNILLGEVWLCSGQSNMEMQMAMYADQPVNGANDELLNATHDDIRLFTVGRNSEPTSQDTCNGKWSVATAENVAVFSAVGYFYAKQLQQRLKVPVGIICSSWGGSRIEAWMSKDVVSQFREAFSQSTKPETKPQNKAAHLFNGMIAPLLNFTIKGVIWYQGESNIS